MIVSVILCTYNRCQTLVYALESVAESSVPESVEWEVLVVDNNSSDQTRQVVDDFCRKYPGRFRYWFERQPGKSYALNTAIRAAHGDVLAFLDDDVTVEPTWLQNLTAPFHDGRWAGVGGRILPKWPCPPPRWVPINERNALALLPVFDLGTAPGPLAEPPFGTNMAFKKAIIEKYGGFRSDLGPRPGSQLRGEDTEFGRRLLEAGEQLWYAPSAVVHHPVTRDRVKQQYFLAWWFDKGRANVLEFGVPENTRWIVASVPLFKFRRLANWALRWLVAIEPSQRFSCKLKVWMLAGEIAESYRQSQRGRTARTRSAN